MNKKQIISWCLYDFADSSFSSVIAAVVFPVYYVKVIVGGAAGWEGDLWWGRAISASMLLVAVSSPFMGGLADRGGFRKRFLFIYTAICVLAVSMFTLLKPGDTLKGFWLMLAANFCMEGALVFYNSFLPEIAPEGYHGRVSAWGFAFGYAGSISALLMSLPLVRAGLYGWVWFSVAIFFSFFSLPIFLFLPGDKPAGMGIFRAAAEGAKTSLQTLRTLWLRDAASRRFLAAFFLYNDGINTVIVFSSIFAATTLGFKPQELVALYLLVQVTALTGAFALAHPTDLWGPKKVIVLSLLLWISVTIGAFFCQAKWQFWAVASCAGFGLGSVQAASRALFSRYFVPEGKQAEHFGAYSLIGKTSAVLGPLVFGWVSAMTRSQRPAVLAVGAFFVAGLLVLAPLKINRPPDVK